jgi:hypothetical protein
LHLATVFNLSSTTAIAYADIARTLLERPIEAAEPWDAAVESCSAPSPRPR